jgi:hypothetical protein
MIMVLIERFRRRKYHESLKVRKEKKTHFLAFKISANKSSRWWSSGKSLGPRDLLPLWSHV